MEFNEIVVKESPGLCRCCLSEGCYKDLGTEYTWMNETEVYADMLLECFDISITQHNEGPNGPNRLICEVCITRLRDACNFKKQVMDSEKKFIDMMGRGEFRPKMLIYQTQMKCEDAAVEQIENANVEYLEDEIEFGDDDLLKDSDSVEASVSDITVSALPIKGKRGRPRKATPVKPEKRAKVAKIEDKPKTSKAVAKELSVEERRKDQLTTILTSIIQNSTIVPFRWHNGQYMCFYCRALFVESSKLKDHSNNVHTEIRIDEIITRTICRGGRTKLDVTDLWCVPCESNFRNFQQYLNHISEVHGLEFDKEAAHSFSCFQLNDKGMFCLECGRHFQLFGSLLLHTYKNHIEHFLCDICGLGFVGKLNIQDHVKKVHGIKCCCICNEMFKTQYALKKHVENLHQIDKLKCDLCPQIFVNTHLKKRHMALEHDCKDEQFICEYCSKIFTRNSKFLQHKQRVHFKEKNCTCEVCGYEAFNLDMLKRHMVRHDDARPFTCDVCEKSFRRKKNLLSHKRSHKAANVDDDSVNAEMSE